MKSLKGQITTLNLKVKELESENAKFLAGGKKLEDDLLMAEKAWEIEHESKGELEKMYATLEHDRNYEFNRAKTLEDDDRSAPSL